MPAAVAVAVTVVAAALRRLAWPSLPSDVGNASSPADSTSAVVAAVSAVAVDVAGSTPRWPAVVVHGVCWSNSV